MSCHPSSCGRAQPRPGPGRRRCFQEQPRGRKVREGRGWQQRMACMQSGTLHFLSRDSRLGRASGLNS
eukprot:8238146-Pyramimonas_sp.AAC.1